MDEERTDQVDTEGHAWPKASDDQPGQGISRAPKLDEEDTEGHGLSARKASDEDEDTEGHGVFSRKASDEDEDTEGHGVFSRKASDDEEDDTEGHRINLK